MSPYIKLLAAYEAHPETAKLKIMPTVPFMEAKIPKKPRISIGIIE
jgi:hypothetical protein